MDYAESEEIELIRQTARDLAADYDREYIREHVENQEFPEEFWQDLADSGFLGTMIPEKYGGAGMGMQEMAVVLEELAHEGTPGGLLLTLTAIFGGVGLTNHGTAEQKEDLLPKIANGDIQFCMGLTESNAGVNTLQIDTHAERDGDEFEISGQKMWISGADHADYMLLIARTSPFDSSNPTNGITLFLVPNPAEQDGISLTPVETLVPWSEQQFQIDIEGLRLDESAILGGPEKEDVALYDLWDTLNTERIAGAASVIGGGLRSIDLAVEYANDRVVFNDPIGAYQSMQHPLAEGYTRLMTAREMTYKAAWKFDQNKACGEEANMAKLQASEAALDVSSHAIQVHGGYGFTPDAEVFPLWVNARLIQTAPVPNEMVKNYIAEHVLGLPRSFLR